jgi:hypothetical protein
MQPTQIHRPARSLLLAGLTLGLVGSVSCLSGCAKSKAPAAAAPAAGECPEGQTFDGQFCQVTGAPPPEAPPAEPTAEPATQPAETAPADVPPASGSGGATSETATAVGGATAAPAPSLATPVDVSMAAQAGPLITYLAGSHLPPGARPFGAPFAAQFAEGQVFEQQVKLTLGKCYTVVAAGLPPVSELVLELHSVATTRPVTTTPTGGVVPTAPVPIAVDAAAGPQAVLGSRAACIKADRSDVWLLLRVSKGQGVVAGQVFEK